MKHWKGCITNNVSVLSLICTVHQTIKIKKGVVLQVFTVQYIVSYISLWTWSDSCSCRLKKRASDIIRQNIFTLKTLKDNTVQMSKHIHTHSNATELFLTILKPRLPAILFVVFGQLKLQIKAYNPYDIFSCDLTASWKHNESTVQICLSSWALCLTQILLK